MNNENFYVIQKNEVQNFAQEIIGRELDEQEYRRAKKMFEFGNESWGEVLKIAIEESINHLNEMRK